jgi:hypothetical protein
LRVRASAPAAHCDGTKADAIPAGLSPGQAVLRVPGLFQ